MDDGIKYSELPVLNIQEVTSTDEIAVLNKTSRILMKIPVNHSTSTHAFGVGTTASYGHNKLQDNLTSMSYEDGVALSGRQGSILARNLGYYESDDVSTATHQIGSCFIWKGVLVKATSTIPVGTEINSTNVEVTTISKELQNSAGSGTVTNIETGSGLTGGPITSAGTIKVDLLTETKLMGNATAAQEVANRIYPVVLDKNGKLAVNVPWESSSGGGTDQNVLQTEIDIDDEYEVLLSGTADGETRTEGANKSTSFKFNPGLGSVMEGINTVATQMGAHAEGYKTSADGHGSHAEGGYLDDKYSTGSGTVAHGINSHAEGSETFARDASSHAEGNSTSCWGSGAHSEGVQTCADGAGAHAEGNYTTAANAGAHAEGGYTSDGEYSEAIGTLATGENAHAEGLATSAVASSAHAEGFLTYASGNYSHAEGKMTTASGICSHAEGGYTTSEDSYDGVVVALGNCSHAGGTGSTAAGVNSFVHGDHLYASNNQSVAFGRWNDESPDTVLSVGNGTADDARSNAFEIKQNGTIICLNIPAPPTTAGTYRLTCVVDGSGNATYSWST